VQMPWPDLANSDTLDNSVRLTTHASAQVMADAAAFGSSKDEMDLNVLMETPQCIARLAMTSTTGPQLVQCTPWYTQDSTYSGANVTQRRFTIFGFVVNQFDWWDGGIKYKLYISSTPFQSAKLRIRYVPFASQAQALAAVGVGALYNQDLFTREYDIQDSCQSIEFTVWPFESRMWRQVQHTQQMDGVVQGNLIFDWVPPGLTQPDAENDAPVYINVYASAAPGFRLAKPCLVPPTYESDIRVDLAPNEAEAFPRGDFAKPFDDFAPAMHGQNTADLNMAGDIIRNLRDLLHAYSMLGGYTVAVSGSSAHYTNQIRFYPTTSSSFPRVGWGETLTQAGVDHITQWRPIFRFWRGGANIKYVFAPDGVTNCTSFTSPAHTNVDGSISMGYHSGPTTYSNPSIRNVLEFNIPWYSPTLFNQTGGSTFNTVITQITNHGGAGTVAYNLFGAAADDFSFGFRQAPPRQAIPTTVAAAMEVHSRRVQNPSTARAAVSAI